MDSWEIYCRLCAKPNPISDLHNLETDLEKFRSICDKLNRVNAIIDFENSCPKMICFTCIASLDSAYDFVMGIENAQKILCFKISLENMKNEDVSVSDRESFKVEIDDNYLRIATPDYTGNDNEDLMVKDNIDIKVAEELNKDLQDVTDNLQAKKIQILKPSESASTDEHEKVKEDTQKPKSVNEKQLDNQPEIRTVENAHKSGNMTWDDYAWTCSICETVFLNSDELIRHSMDKHNRCNAFCCTICHKRRNCLKSMINHIYSHERSLLLSCFKCRKTFDTERKMIAHRKTHIYTNHYCVNCNTSFKDEQHLNKHKEMYSARRTEKLVENECHMCDICGKTFSRLRYLEIHRKIHSGLKYECKICKKTFKSTLYLRHHVSVHDNIKPYTCDHCRKSFRLKNELVRHIVIHIDKYPHKCHLCDKSFKHKNKLSDHILLHSGIHPYSCESCQWDFTNYTNYFKHMIGRHKTDIRKRKPEIKDVNAHLEWKEQVKCKKTIGRPRIKRKEKI